MKKIIVMELSWCLFLDHGLAGGIYIPCYVRQNKYSFESDRYLGAINPSKLGPTHLTRRSSDILYMGALATVFIFVAPKI